jgi:hypothetical protein
MLCADSEVILSLTAGYRLTVHTAAEFVQSNKRLRSSQEFPSKFCVVNRKCEAAAYGHMLLGWLRGRPVFPAEHNRCQGLSPALCCSAVSVSEISSLVMFYGSHYIFRHFKRRLFTVTACFPIFWSRKFIYAATRNNASACLAEKACSLNSRPSRARHLRLNCYAENAVVMKNSFE